MKSIDLLAPRSMLLTLGIALFAFTLVPPQTYAHAMNEPDLMFGNPRLYIFLACSLASLAVGLRLGRTGLLKHRARGEPRFRIPAVLHLLPPAAIAIGLLALTLKLLLQHNAAIPGLLLAGRAEDAKIVAIHASQGALTGSLPCAIATLWWLILRYLKLPADVSRASRVLSLLVLLGMSLALLTATLLLVARSVLLPALFGALLIPLAYQAQNDSLTSGRLLWRSFLAGVGALGIFAVFAFARGFDTAHALMGNLIGYGPASINHLAALLDGRFDTGALDEYLRLQNFGFIYHFPLASRLSDAAPNGLKALASAFTQSARAGLNGSYIWMTAFGELWAGIRWWTFPYLLVVGFLFSWSWHGFRQQRTFSTVLYCWLAFGVLFYFGANYLASGYFSAIAMTALALGIYDHLVGPRPARIDPT